MKKIIATCLFTLFLVSSLFAQSNTQTNFTIAPPPLGYPEFPEEGSFSNKIDFLYASVQGKVKSNLVCNPTRYINYLLLQ